jgi:tetratricopeptide (TPR) repeat protein
MANFILVTILVLGAVTASAQTNVQGQSKPAKVDPVAVVLDAYAAKSNELRTQLAADGNSEKGKLEFYKSWRTRILAVVSQNPASPNRIAAYRAAEALSNGLGDYAESEALVQQVAMLQDSAQGRFSSYSEAGEVARAQFQNSRNRADAEKSIQYFQKALAEIGDGHELSADPAAEYLREKVIIDLVLCADMQAAGTMDQKAAMDTLERARGLYKTVDFSKDTRLRTLGFDPEGIIWLEVQAAINEKDVKSVKALLAEFDSIPNPRQSISYYVWQCVDRLYPAKGADYCRDIQEWLQSHPNDSDMYWTPLLKYYLAVELVNEERYPDALPVLKELKDRYTAVLTAADEKGGVKDRGGYMADVLYNLARTYNSLGNASEAKLMEKAFVELVPKDPRALEILPTMGVPHVPNAETPGRVDAPSKRVSEKDVPDPVRKESQNAE